MAKATPIISALNGGEWSPFLDGRVDVDGYAASAFRCENAIPTIEGPVIKRAGSGFVRQVKDVSDVTRLVPFVKSRGDAVMIEFGDLYCRFYVNRSPVVVGASPIFNMLQTNPVQVGATTHGYSDGQDVFITGVVGMTQVNGRWFKVANASTNAFDLHTIHGEPVDGTEYSTYLSGGDIAAPYEIVSPYSAAALTGSNGELGIDFAQVGDVIYITDRSRTLAPRKLARSGPTSWAFSTVEPGEGPFGDLNASATTIYSSGASGTVTLTASASIFTAADVGRLIRVDQQVITATLPWKAATAYTAGQFVRSEGKEYVAANSATSGTTIPDHSDGTVSDGAVNWTYVSPGYGVARITAQSGTTAAATVIVPFPQTLVGSGNASSLWRRGDWFAGNYPSTVSFFRERLAFGSGLRVQMSVAGDYENFAIDFAGEVLPESAITLELPGPANEIVAMQEGQALFVLTEGGEFAVGPQATNEPLGPNNIQATGQTSYGARPVRPVRVGAAVLYVQSSGERVRSLQYSWESESFISPDQTIRARHVPKGGVSRLVRQESPYGVVWGVRADGQLIAFTYDQDQSARAWSRHVIGAVEDVAVIPSPDGSRDDVWLSVRRTVNGGTRRYIEYIRAEYQTGDNQDGATYVDSGLTYDGASASVLYGFDHLEGETVAVMRDGAASPDVVVSNGEVRLASAAAVVQAGLRYGMTFATNRIEAGAADGTAQSKTKRIHDVAFRVLDSLGGSAGPGMGNMDDIPALNYRSPSTPMGHPSPLFSGDALVLWPGGYETDGRIWYYNDTVFPATLVAIIPQVVTQENR
jgi:hypothetical protein